MKKDKVDKLIKRLDLVVEETEKDVKSLEGKPFTGKVVAEYHGYMSAGIVALAATMKEILDEMKE